MKIDRLHIDITNDCNMRCSYCFVTCDNKQGMHGNANMLLKVVRYARGYGITAFSISGGEPLQHPQFLDILRACGKKSHVTLFSNMEDVDQALLNEIASVGNVKRLIMSLDGFDGHNKARPPSKWRNVVNTMKSFRSTVASCTSVTVNTVVTKYNVDELPMLHDFLHSIAITHWRVDMPMRSSRVGVYCTFEQAIFKIVEIIKSRYIFPKYSEMEVSFFKIYKSNLEGVKEADVAQLVDPNTHPCIYNFGQMAVNAEGMISICTPLHIEMGDAKLCDSFEEMVALYEHHSFFALRQNNIKYCPACRYFKLCGTDCRADAMDWTGSIYEPNPVACSIMPLVETHIIPHLSSSLASLYRAMINTEGQKPRYAFRSQKKMYDLLEAITLKGGEL